MEHYFVNGIYIEMIFFQYLFSRLTVLIEGTSMDFTGLRLIMQQVNISMDFEYMSEGLDNAESRNLNGF